MNKIEYTERGFNFVKVTPIQNVSWGGYCVCNGCNGQFINEDMYLVFVLGDCYCERCFKEWLERAKKYKQEDVNEDLRYQKEHSFQWYKYHLPYLEKEED